MTELDKDVEQRFDEMAYDCYLTDDNYKQEVKQFLAQELAKKDAEIAAAKEGVEKAFGGCRRCYGKGYSTYIKPGSTASSDFPDHAPMSKTVIEKPKRSISFCSCQRGEDLKKEFVSAKEEGAREEREHIIDSFTKAIIEIAKRDNKSMDEVAPREVLEYWRELM